MMGLETIAAIAGIGSAVAGIGSSIYSMTTRPKKPDTVLPFDKSKEAAYAEAERMRKRRAAGTLVTDPGTSLGAASTIKTQLGA